MRRIPAILGCLLLVAGCSSGGGGQSSTVGGVKAAAAPKIGVAEINLSLPFFVQMDQASSAIAKAYGVNVTWQSADGSLENEISIVQNYISQHKKIIMIDPVDAKALVPVVNKATRAGIKVVTMGNKVGGTKNHNTLYPDHNNWVTSARIIGHAMHGHGKVLFLIGSVGNYVSDTRQQAFEQTMKKEFPKIKVITEPTNFDASTAVSVTDTVLTAHPDIAGVASISDSLTLAVLKVLQSHKKLGIPVVTNDGDPAMYPYIDRGQVLSDMLTGSYRVGAWNTAVAARLAHGRGLPTDLFMPTYAVSAKKSAARLTKAGYGLDYVTTARARALSAGYQKEFQPAKSDAAMTVGN